MQYMLLIYGNERASESAPREQMTEIINAFNAFTQALRDARVWVASNRLRPTSAATSVRTADGKTQPSVYWRNGGKQKGYNQRDFLNR